MRKNSFLEPGISLSIIVLWAAGSSAWAQSPVLPQAVANAHTVYIQNESGFVELEYATILELGKWGHFELAERREKADLILRLDTGSRVRVAADITSLRLVDIAFDSKTLRVIAEAAGAINVYVTSLPGL